MKCIVAVAFLGAIFFVAVQAAPNEDAQGVAGFPLRSLNGVHWKNKIKKIVDTFNEYAGSSSAYSSEEVDDLVKITGELLVVASDGENHWVDKVFLDRKGKAFFEKDEEIKGARGIIGGNKTRLYTLTEGAIAKVTEGFKKGEACLSSLPNDIWVFGKASFENAATIAAETAKMITQLGEDAWTRFVPLSKAQKDDVAKLVKSGIDLAIEPAKILKDGAGAGFNAMRDLFGVAAGVPLAIGSSMARTGADIVSTGAGMIGKVADNAKGFGQNIAGLNKHKN